MLGDDTRLAVNLSDISRIELATGDETLMVAATVKITDYYVTRYDGCQQTPDELAKIDATQTHKQHFCRLADHYLGVIFSGHLQSAAAIIDAVYAIPADLIPPGPTLRHSAFVLILCLIAWVSDNQEDYNRHLGDQHLASLRAYIENWCKHYGLISFS